MGVSKKNSNADSSLKSRKGASEELAPRSKTSSIPNPTPASEPLVNISGSQIDGHLSVKATQKVYENCIINQKGGVKLDLSHSNLQPLDFKTPLTLSALFNRYFTPLQSYESIAPNLYGPHIVTPTGEVEYPLWQIRQAYLNTTQWFQTFDKILAAYSSSTVKSDEEAAVELAIAKVLKHTLTCPKEGLSQYSGCSDSLDALIALVTQTTLHQQAAPHHTDSLTYALSLLITLGLRDSTQGSLRSHILSFLKGEKVTFSFKVKSSTHTTTELTLNPKLIMRDLMFIDFRYTYWSTLNLDGIEFSGADFTGAFFVKSQYLTKARYTCFHHIETNQYLTFKERADCTGSHWYKVDLSEAEGNTTIFEWSCFNHVLFNNESFLKAKTKSLYKGKKNIGDFIKKLENTLPKKKHFFKKSNNYTKAKQPPPHVMKYAQHRAQWGLAQMYVKHWPQAIDHLTIAIDIFKHLSWLLHLGVAHTAYGASLERKSRRQTSKQSTPLEYKALADQQYEKGIQCLLEAWVLSPNIISSLQSTSPTLNEKILGIQDWKKLFAAFTLAHHQQYYTDLCNASYHTDDNPDEENNAQCIKYLNFVKTIWPKDTELYNTLLNIPNTVGYRQSERIAYQTLAASIQQLCLDSQSKNDGTLHNVEAVNHDITLTHIKITSPSVGKQRLLLNITQQLTQHKLLDINTGEFKPHQYPKTKQKTEAINSQHRIIRIDFGFHGIYTSSEPDIPRQAVIIGFRGRSIHLKIHPDLPMMDYTTDIFNRRLIGHGSPASELAILTVTQKTKDSKLVYKKRYPILISQTVEGLNLKTVLDKTHTELLKILDNKSSSEFFIAEVLKHPGDGFSRNYVIKQQNPSSTQIVSVDNSQMFVEPVVEVKPKYGLKHKELQERSIIYCLSQVIQTPLDSSALNTIMNLQDVVKVLTAWLKTVEAREKRYVDLFTKEDLTKWNKERGSENPFVPYALFRTGAVSLLAMQLRYLQSLFRVRHSKKGIIMPHLVMEKLNPRLLHYYKAISKELGHQALTSEAAFKQATGAVQSMSSRQATRAILGKVPDKVINEQQFNQLKETAQTSSLVHLALDELNFLGKQLLADVKDKPAFNITDEGDWELYVDFQPPKKTSSSQFSSINKMDTNDENTTHTIEETKAQQIIAKLVKTASKQKEWIDNLLLENTTFKTLVLSHCLGLDDERLIDLTRNSQHLEYLDITGCQQITEQSLRALASHCKELRTLKASRTEIVNTKKKTGPTQTSRLLPFPKLTTLHLSDCVRETVNRHILRLTRLALDAPALETLKINNNPSLRSVELPHSIKLTHLNLQQAEPLTQLKIPAEAQLITLNIGGCKQITEEQLTLDSRLLLTLNLKGCSQLAHGDFRQRYPSLFTALPWQHYKESFVENLSATLEEMLITNYKTIEWKCVPIQTRARLHKTLYKWGKFGQDVILILSSASKEDTEIDSWRVCEAAARALWQCLEHNPSSVIPELLNALEHHKGNYSSKIRFVAAQAMAQCIKHKLNSVVSALLNTLNDNDSDVHQAATKTLELCVEHHPHSIIPLLLGALKDNDSSRVHLYAVQALGQCHEHLSNYLDSATPALLNTLKDNNSDVHQAATKTLELCIEHHPHSIIPLLLSTLKDNDSSRVHLYAVQALRQCHEHLSSYLDSVIPALLNALNDNNSDVRQAATKTLELCVEHHPHSIIPLLLSALKDNDSSRVHLYAVQALKQCHEHLSSYLDSVIPALLSALNDNNSDVRQAATKTLELCVEHHPHSIIPLLLSALKDNDSSRVHLYAVQALKQCHEHLRSYLDSVIPALLSALKDHSSDVRQGAAKTLGLCHEHLSSYLDSVIPALLSALKDHSYDVRQSAAKTLGLCHENLNSHLDSVIPALLNTLKDSDSDVRQSAVKTLGQCHEHLNSYLDSVIPELLSALKDHSYDVRQSAAETLGLCHEHLSSYLDSIIPALLKALKSDKYSDVHQSVARTLELCIEHYPHSVIPLLLSALKDNDSWRALYAVQALRQYHEHLNSHLDSVIPALLNTLKDHSSDVRQSATEALGQCHEHLSNYLNSVIPKLLNALKDNNPGVRQTATKTLELCIEHHSHSIIPVLLSALKYNDSWRARLYAVQALRQCHEHLNSYFDSVIPTLLNALKSDKYSGVRLTAAQALGQCHENFSGYLDSIIPALLNTLKDSDSDVRQSATEALGQYHEHLSSYLDSVILALLNTLKDSCSDVRQAATKTLKLCVEHPNSHLDFIIATLLKTLRDNDSWSFRKSAVKTLGQCHEHLSSYLDSIIPTLLNAALKDHSYDVRQTATKTLELCVEHHAHYIIPVLLNTLKNNDSLRVRLYVVHVLRQCHEHFSSHLDSVIPALLSALKDHSSDIRQSTAKTLRQCHEHLSSYLDSIIPELLNTALNDNNSDVRQAATKTLELCVEHHPHSVIPVLLSALKDNDSLKIRPYAVQALRQCHEHLNSYLDSVIPELLSALKDHSYDVRQSAAETLGLCHEHLSSYLDSIIPALLKALKSDKYSDVRQSVARTLGLCHENLNGYLNSVIPELFSTAFKDNNSGVRQTATKTLELCIEHYPHSVIPLLLSALKDHSSDVRQGAAKTLGLCHEHLSSYLDSVIPALLSALKDHSYDVRQSAAKTLGLCHENLNSHLDSVIPALLNTLKDSDSDVRQSAVKTLGQCHEHLNSYLDSVIPELLSALKDHSYDVRQSAAETLGLCHEHLSSYLDSIIPALLKALKSDKYSDVRQSVARTLGLCHENLNGYLNSVIPELFSTAFKDNNSGVRQTATKTLELCIEHYPHSVIPLLLSALKDNDSWRALYAVQALRQYHEHLNSHLDSVIPALLNTLKDHSSDVRQSATEALGQCHEHLSNYLNSVIPKLLNALKDNNPGVRQTATKTLELCIEHHSHSIIPVLLSALKYNDSWRARLYAVQALRQCHEHLNSYFDSVIPTLLNALKSDKYSGVRQAAAQALGQCHENFSGYLDSIIPALLNTLKDSDSDVRQSATEALGQYHEHLSSYPDSVIPALLNALKSDKYSGVRQAAIQVLGTIGSVNTLQSWIKNIFNENKANLESESTLEQKPPPDNAIPYSSVFTQQTSSPHTELPTLHSHSHNKSAKREEHEETYSNKEI